MILPRDPRHDALIAALYALVVFAVLFVTRGLP